MDTVCDLEQQLLNYSMITSDIHLVVDDLIDNPEFAGKMDAQVEDYIMNKFGAIAQLYEVKFQALWKTFERVASEVATKNIREDSHV